MVTLLAFFLTAFRKLVHLAPGILAVQGKTEQVQGFRIFSKGSGHSISCVNFPSGRGNIITIDDIFPNRQSRSLNMYGHPFRSLEID